jgi:hypothetical protein
MIVVRFDKPGAAAGAPIDGAADRAPRIGRSEACALRLMHPDVRFVHAIMRAEGQGVVIEAQPGAVLGQARAPVARAVLARPGDATWIGPFKLTLAAAGAAGHATLDVVEEGTDAEDEAALARREFARFDSRLPNVRLWSLLAVCAILLVFFALPLGLHPGRAGIGRNAAGAADAASLLGHAQLKVAGLWNVGVMSNAHASFGADCAHCHQTPFIRTTSRACLTCHVQTGQHADPLRAPKADISAMRCETCHHEHKGAVMATADRQSGCAACHGNIKAFASSTTLHDVLDFGQDHPQFMPALVQDAALHALKRYDFSGVHGPDSDVVDHSNIKFTHATHLKLEKVKAGMQADGCGLCHAAEPGGVSFKRVSFEASCLSCHTLQFEPNHPEWRLPHGHPDEVGSRVAGFYAQAALAGESAVDPPTDPFFKPGVPRPLPPPSGQNQVTLQVAQAMVSSIARSSCGECHVVVPPAPGQPATAWTIPPVWVPDRYFPAARFSHAAHATSTCRTCHAAETSDGGPLALLPGIATCRTCHAGEGGAPQRVSSTCVLCHVFHDDRLPLWSKPHE